MNDSSETLGTVGAKLAPPTVYATAYLGGLSIADWVSILTALYLLLQIALLIPKYLEWFRTWRAKCRSKQDLHKQERQ